ncbi:toll/interleukin-1 receptor domain-containing protein [Brevibacterium sp. 1718]|uniref:toll/interleukin-1 receptor domain-containing protein n=1 Tax=Brevibacterium sp. 1718 TaxID=3413510 RepID=UPI003DA8FAC0
MNHYIQIWEFDYGDRENVLSALNRVNIFDKDVLTGMTIYWSDIPYDLRLFSELAFLAGSSSAKEKALEAQEILANAGGKVRTDITPESLVEALSKRRLNSIGTLEGMEIVIPFEYKSKLELEKLGFDFSSWVAKSRVFLSHQSDRKPEVTELQQLLADRNVPTWFDIHDIEYGQNLATAIEGGVRSSDAVIFWVSDGFLRSNWCRSEFESFLSRYMGRRDVTIFAAIEEDCLDVVPDSLKQLKFLKLDSPGDPLMVANEFAVPIKRVLAGQSEVRSSEYWPLG